MEAKMLSSGVQTARLRRTCENNTKGYSSTYLAAFLGTRPNISEPHSEIRTRVPLCIALEPPRLALASLGSTTARNTSCLQLLNATACRAIQLYETELLPVTAGEACPSPSLAVPGNLGPHVRYSAVWDLASGLIRHAVSAVCDSETRFDRLSEMAAFFGLHPNCMQTKI